MEWQGGNARAGRKCKGREGMRGQGKNERAGKE